MDKEVDCELEKTSSDCGLCELNGEDYCEHCSYNALSNSYNEYFDDNDYYSESISNTLGLL